MLDESTMPDEQVKLPESVKTLLEGLRGRVESTRNAIRAISVIGDAYAADFVFMAALYRSLSLLNGFIVLTQDRNAFCTGALVRLQLDNLLKCYALHVADPRQVNDCLLRGKRFATVKSRDGKPLTEKYLHEALSQHLPWVSRVYSQTSGFVHLSDVHVWSFLKVHPTENRFQAYFGWEGPAWPEDTMVEAVQGFTAITDALLALHAVYLQEKRDRTGPETGTPSS